ncbi:aspartate ammonia-lyase [Liquorilactobacillus vini]|uniref:aspartate ammonia-lyase n=1 Tax=Liquorilactobacillus vini TaxID=238015 RepID=UPI0002D49CA8|nr:aspartate ammonia-lyase [Liquorilactobacillus vini]
MRIEKDAIGTLKITDDAYYGIHAKRAAENFPLGETRKVDPLLLKGLIQVKQACAETNYLTNNLTKEKFQAIVEAGDELQQNFEHYQQEFIVPNIQGGAGTSTNMNVNEVIANRALELLGHQKGEYQFLHPNDDVNRSQSTNDTYPTAGHLALIKVSSQLTSTVQDLIVEFKKLAQKNKHVLKLGRTQLEDAVPTTYGLSFQAYADLLQRCKQRLQIAREKLMTIPLGGTAIGTGINTTTAYQQKVVPVLVKRTGLPLKQAENLIDAVQNTDCYLETADAFKNLATSLGKISNDLRLLGSGPRTGLGELKIPKVQAGSSIMPGKVNPVIPEFVNQIAFQIIGYATTVTFGVEAGQLELNAFEPVMFQDLLDGARLLTAGIQSLITNCLQDLTINEDLCQSNIEHSAEIATILAPKIGYAAATQLVKQALSQKVSIRSLLQSKDFSTEKIEQLLSPENLLGPKCVKDKALAH